MADPSRLRILGALAEHVSSGNDLGRRLGLTSPTISHHRVRLVGAGLVRVATNGERRGSVLDVEPIRDLGRDADPPTAPTTGPADATTADERAGSRVLRDFFADGRLKQIPAQRRKRVVVLQHLVARFAPDRDYPEREVNDRLRQAHDDVATLRRDLVDYGFMTRSNGVSRVAGTLPARGPTVAQEIVGDEQSWLRTLVDGATTRAPGSAAVPRPIANGDA